MKIPSVGGPGDSLRQAPAKPAAPGFDEILRQQGVERTSPQKPEKPGGPRRESDPVPPPPPPPPPPDFDPIGP